MRIIECFVLSLMLSGQALALEVSAGADNVNASQVGINAKLDANNAALTAVLNKILNCSKTGQSYNSTTDSCVSVAVDLTDALADKDIEIYKDYKTASVAIPSCYKGGRFSSCQANINLKTIVPDNAQGLQISFLSNMGGDGKTWRHTANFQVDSNSVTTCQMNSWGSVYGGCPPSGGDGSYQFAILSLTNGVGTITSGQGRTGGGAALGGMLTVKYYVLKGKLVPKGS